MKYRPLHDWILVEMDPLEYETRGGIVLPHGNEVRKATVVDLGPDVRDLERGERLAFHRAHAQHKQGQSIAHVLGSNLMLIKPRDVLIVMAEDIEVTV